MSLKTTIKKSKDLTLEEMNLMNKARKKEFGKKEEKNFKKDYPQKSRFFFVKHKEKIVSFGILMPIKINFHGKVYKIYGVCSIISLKKKKGYGKILMHTIIDFLKENKKTGIGFSGKKNTRFYQKSGFETIEDFIHRFQYKNPLTGDIEIDLDGDGFFYEGKDRFLERVKKSKDIVYIDIPFW